MTLKLDICFLRLIVCLLSLVEINHATMRRIQICYSCHGWYMGCKIVMKIFINQHNIKALSFLSENLPIQN